MKWLFLFFLVFAGYRQVCSQKVDDEQLEALSKIISQSDKYDEGKLIKIEEFNHRMRKADTYDSFESYRKLYEEYSLFRSDSAYWYARKMQAKAATSGDPSLIAYARMKLAFVLLSSGMLKEAFDSLSMVYPNHLDNEKKAEYYSMMARYYYDLADYTQEPNYRLRYNSEGGTYIDSALVLYPFNSFAYDYYSGLKNIRTLNFDKASEYLQRQLNQPGLSSHEVALTASTLSDIFIRNGKNDIAIRLLTTAAIADIQSSTKETSAIFNLATLLFQRGDLENAAVFIQKAASDASFYGSRQRKAQLSLILPLIKEEKLRALEIEKTKIFTYAIIVTVSFALLVVLITIIVRQIKKLQTQQKVIGQKNNTLQHLVEEKEWLLKEIHHRVKNNLQTVVSLLESQSHYLENDALQAVQSSQHRVYAMSLIHHKLYQANNPGTINMMVYLPELVNYLSDSFNIGQRIRFQLLVKDIELDVSQAIPLGLILNEAITNAIKYAFPHHDNNQISIAMERLVNNQVELRISDNGIGLPITFQSNKNESLGVKLMNGLTEDIGGSLSINSEKGTTIIVRFQANPLAEDANKTRISK